MDELEGGIKATLFRWIEEQTGLYITSINQGPVLLTVKVLSTQRRLSQSQYITALINRQIPVQPFLDEVTTHESFFLRHRKHMLVAIEEIIRPLINKGVRPRVLCAPCAQGEEPYSLAMLLLDHGINPAQVEIVGVDIAESSIQQAKQHTYRNYALRKVPADFIQRHFKRVGEMYQVNSVVQRAVEFKRLNLLTDANAQLVPGFHLIFSHNMLIYFDRPVIERMVNTFKLLLSDDGWLFVDSVETSQPTPMLEGDLLKGTRVFRKSNHPRAVKAKAEALKQKPHSAAVSNVSSSMGGARQEQPPARQSAISNGSYSKRELAKKAYENKQFDEAIALYDQLIQQHEIWGSWARIGKAKVLLDSGKNMEALEEASGALRDRKMKAGIYLTREDEADAHAVIALVLHLKGMHEKKSEHLEQIRRLNPEHETLRLIS